MWFKLNNFYYFIWFFLVNIINISFGAKDNNFASELTKCHRDDNKCIENAITFIARNNPNGLAAIGLPSIEPYRANEFIMIHDHIPDHEININWKARNVELYGWSKSIFTVEGFEKDILNSNITVKVTVPDYISIADYKLKMKYKKRPSHGKGRLEFKFPNSTFVVNFSLAEYTKKNEQQHLKVNAMQLDYLFNEVTIEFGDLFDGNQELGKMENQFLNDNREHFFNLMKTIILPNFKPIFTNIIDGVFERYSVDDLFLTD